MNLTAPGAASTAYRAASRIAGTDQAEMLTGTASAPGAASREFGKMFADALSGPVAALNHSEATSIRALNGTADPVDLATALANAELHVQTTMAIRDKAVQAFLEVMRMPI